MPFWSILGKDLRIVSRDRSALILLFLMPVLFIVTFGLIFQTRDSQSARSSPFTLLVGNFDTGQEGTALIAQLQSLGLATETARGGERDVVEQVQRGERPIGLIIPPDFSAELKRLAESDDGKAVPIRLRVLIDPAQSTLAPIAEGAIQGAAQRVAGHRLRQAKLEQIPEEYRDQTATFLGNENAALVTLDVQEVGGNNGRASPQFASSASDVLVPNYAVLFVFFLANNVAVALINERQEGTLRRMLCAPIAPGQILSGKLLARGVLGVIQMALLFGIGIVWLHLNVSGSLPGLLLTIGTTIFAATGLGLLIAAFGKTVEQISGMTTLTLFLMGAISGCMVPRMLLPPAMQKLSLLTPHAWALNAYQDVLRRHLPLMAALPNIGMVFLFGLIFYFVALARFRCE